MPVARFQMPDGRVARFEVPDGTTPEQAQSMMEQHFGGQQQPAAAPISRTDKVIRGMTDPIEGGAQLLTHMLPSGVVNAGNQFNNWLANKTGIVAPIPEGGMDALVSSGEKAYQDKRQAAGESGFDGYRLMGNIASPANIALAAKLPVAATMAGRVGVGALGGGATAAINPVTDGEFWKEKGRQVGVGAATGGLVPAVTGAVSRVISPKASTDAGLKLLKAEGVKPTVGQSLGGWANTMEERAQSLPFVGDSIASSRMAARDQFNNAAINRATAPIGVKIRGTGTQAVAEAGDAIGAVYDKAKASLGGFKIDQQAQAELTSLRNMASSGLQGREKNAVAKYFSDYLNRPTLTAQSFKELDSKLNSDIARFGAGDAYQQKVADALKEVQRVVTDNAKRANPVAADLFKKADKAYANLVRVEGASVGAKGADGVFTPGQLLTAVRGADRSVRDRATARGGALMQDLASAGQRVLGNKVPDSGTAGRLSAAGLGASAVAFPWATTAGVVGGMAAYTSPAQALLRSLVSSRPQAAQPVADALREISPYLIPGGAQVGLGLLNQ